jgi:signal transduction histidine kinase
VKILGTIRSHLVWKLFFSYLTVLLVGGIVQVTAAELVMPTAFQNHLALMARLMNALAQGQAQGIEADLFTGFRSAFTEALGLAAIAAFATGLLASFFVSHQVGSPVRAMMSASQRIAEGDYHERVKLPEIPVEQLDELNQLALSFNQMATRLEQTETMRRQLIGDVAHELRTPLAAIKGSLEGLVDGVLPATPETFNQIQNEAERLQRLVNDLQELSRVEAGAYELHLHAVAPGGLTRVVMERLSRQYEEKGVALEMRVPENLPAVLVDEDRIGQVLLNLVGNALQYTQAGGKVVIQAHAEGNQVLFSVQDNGRGISAEHLPLIFTRFYRVDKSRSRAGGGSGIGLTIAKYLVEAHGGRIWAESEGEGKGSTFNFGLPVAPDYYNVTSGTDQGREAHPVL